MAAASKSELAPLLAILSREEAIYEELFAVATEERQRIVERRLPELKSVLQRKQELLLSLSELEDRRVAWLHRYAGRHHMDIDTVTLAEIIDQSPAPDSNRLERLHRALRQRIDRVVEVNRVTSTLLAGILKSIDESLHFLLADDGAGATYGAQGRLLSGMVAGRQLVETRA